MGISLFHLTSQIISVDTSPANVVLNVPDTLATEIPPVLLIFSDMSSNVSVINQKTWTHTQVST